MPQKPLRWLHLSDIHLGCPGRELWWQLIQQFAASLKQDLARHGQPDLILITGDIAFSGQAAQYQQCNAFLAQLFTWLKAEPPVIPVPGNHDLARPTGMDLLLCSVLEKFAKGNDDPGVKELNRMLWEQEPADTSLFTPLFGNYQAWLTTTILPQLQRHGVQVHLSPFPGDLSVSLNLPERPPLQVVGLNSAWRQVGDLEEGGLEIFRQQLFHAWPQDEGANPNRLLLLHHPPAWFSPLSSELFAREIYPPARFAACLHGHMHRGRSTSTATCGGEPRHFFQAPSLFGLERYGRRNEERAMGYAWGELDLHGAIRVWPMRQQPHGDGSLQFLFDPAFGEPRWVPLRPGEPPPPPKPKEESDSEEIRHYQEWALARYGSVALIGVGGADLTLDLAKVYVPLRISQRAHVEEMEQDPPQAAKVLAAHSDGEVELADIFRKAKGHHVALFGDPGAGKSTALRKLLHHTLALGPDSLGLPVGTLPLFLRLRRFGEEFLGQPLAAFIQHQLEVDGVPGLAPGVGERWWQRGRLLLLLDGLDEIADQGLRAKVARKLEHDLRHQGVRGIHAALSCRYAGYGELVRLDASFLHLDVRPLDDHLVAAFIRLWFREAHLCLPKGDPARAAQDAEKLVRNLEEPRYANQQIKVLVGNPLLLTLLCVVVLQRHEIPRRRVKFYSECLEVLLYRWRYLQETEEPPLALEQALSVLRAMAWNMHRAGRQYDLSAAEFADLAEGVLERQGGLSPGLDGFQVLRWLQVTCGVLEEYAPKRYGLMHLGFQEYLTAAQVAGERQSLVAELAGKAGKEWWREVILLVAGHDDPDLLARLIRALLPRVQEEEQAHLLREVVAEAPVVDLAPFLELLPVKGDAATQTAILRLLLGRGEESLRAAAALLARDSQHQGVRELAGQLLAQAQAPAVEGHEFDLLLLVLPEERGQAEALAAVLTKKGLHLWPVADASWLTEIEWALPRIADVAVLVGQRAPWDDAEIRGAMSLFARRGRRLWPVWLPAGGTPPSLPDFMCHWQAAETLDRAVRSKIPATTLRGRVRLTASREDMIVDGLQSFFKEPNTGMNFMTVFGGRFIMGSNDNHANERPAHPVQLSKYWLAETPVTNRQYERYRQSVPKALEPKFWRDRRFSDPLQPVVGVSWHEAMAFCDWLTQVSGDGLHYTLPSEAQWEFAARGPDGRSYPWGNEEPTKERACFGQDFGRGQPAAVGSFPAGKGRYGHLDLAGNVWEWCLDRWQDDYSQWQEMPLDSVAKKGPDRFVVRGGSWDFPSGGLRSACRFGLPAGGRLGGVGFRVAAAPASR